MPRFSGELADGPGPGSDTRAASQERNPLVVEGSQAERIDLLHWPPRGSRSRGGTGTPDPSDVRRESVPRRRCTPAKPTYEAVERTPEARPALLGTKHGRCTEGPSRAVGRALRAIFPIDVVPSMSRFVHPGGSARALPDRSPGHSARREPAHHVCRHAVIGPPRRTSTTHPPSCRTASASVPHSSYLCSDPHDVSGRCGSGPHAGAGSANVRGPAAPFIPQSASSTRVLAHTDPLGSQTWSWDLSRWPARAQEVALLQLPVRHHGPPPTRYVAQLDRLRSSRTSALAGPSLSSRSRAA